MDVSAVARAPQPSATPADGLLTSFVEAGYVHVNPPLLQPAEPFLDQSGEDIRKSLYLTTDPGGEELCLRPDLTIPVARDYLASAAAGRPAGFCYCAPVFRYRGERASEFLQAGAESFGRDDTAAADAEMLVLALNALRDVGVRDIEIRMGDVALFAALIDALDLFPVWKRRLLKDFNRKTDLAHDIEQMTLSSVTRPNEYAGVLAALAGSDRKAALALVSDLMAIAGATSLGGRSASEIADRFLEQSTLTGSAFPAEALRTIQRFLAIQGEPDQALVELRTLAHEARLDLSVVIDQLENRVGFMAAHGIDTHAIRFSTSFGRGIDYYTGFEFELHAPGNGAEPLVAGGRYDRLMTRLGSPMPIAAVGFSIWVENLNASRDRSAL